MERLFTSYYWHRGFLMLAPSFVLERQEKPYRRLSATLMYAAGKPFLIETGEGTITEARAVLIAPKVLRRRIVAVDSDLMICDLSVATPHFDAVASLLCGAATSLDQLVASRILQGAAGGLLAPMTQMMIARIAGRHMARVMGYTAVYALEVLLLIARLMRSSFRYHDRLYRFGGEEFVVLLPETSADTAMAIAERIRATTADRKSGCTVSIGVTSRGNDSDTVETMLARADAGRQAAAA